MPNRIIYESICTSENINELSWFAEVLFTRLTVNADDFGRMDGRTAILKSRLFPLRFDAVKDKDLEAALEDLQKADLIQIYKVAGKPYVQITTWSEHQTCRASKSKYPGPDEADAEQAQTSANNCKQLKTIANNCEQMQANDINCNQLQANVSVNENVNDKRYSINENEKRARAHARGEVVKERFTQFWDAYPRREGKGAAFKAFEKINPSQDLLLKMLSTIEKYKQTDRWNKDGGQYIPLPATWLNQGRWDDDPPEGKMTMSKAVDATKFDQREYNDADFDSLYVNLG